MGADVQGAATGRERKASCAGTDLGLVLRPCGAQATARALELVAGLVATSGQEPYWPVS